MYLIVNYCAVSRDPRSYATDAFKPEPPRQMTDLEKKRLTFQFLRKVQRDARNVGKRLKYKAKREAKAAKDAAKAAK